MEGIDAALVSYFHVHIARRNGDVKTAEALEHRAQERQKQWAQMLNAALR